MTIFVVISCSDIADRIRDAVDEGRFSDANELTYKMKALSDKLQSIVAERGGHLHVNLIDRQVMEITQSVAEDLPMILEGYFSTLPARPAVGMGLSFYEASQANKLARMSDEIEMYDPEDPRYQDLDMFKTDPSQNIGLPINMFDPTVPKTNKIAPEGNATLSPEAGEELQIGAEYIQAIAETLMPPPPPPQPGQPGQDPNQDPRDLREALEGGQVPGYAPEEGDEDGEGSEKESDDEEDDSEDDGETEKGEEDDEEDPTDKKLVGLMHTVQSAIPQIMELQSKDPKAFKAAHKLVDAIMRLTRDRQIKKAEAYTAELEKAVASLRLPVHSRKDNSKKVVKNGKQVWRQMAAGQVKDLQGEAISVKSSNKLATGK